MSHIKQSSQNRTHQTDAAHQEISSNAIITGKKTKEVHNSKPGSNHAPETENRVSNHQTTTTREYKERFRH